MPALRRPDQGASATGAPEPYQNGGMRRGSIVALVMLTACSGGLYSAKQSPRGYTPPSEPTTTRVVSGGPLVVGPATATAPTTTAPTTTAPPTAAPPTAPTTTTATVPILSSPLPPPLPPRSGHDHGQGDGGEEGDSGD
jgi:hypothetical protein